VDEEFHRVQANHSEGTPFVKIPCCATITNLGQLVTLAEGRFSRPALNLIKSGPFPIV
jgi:hypothetical protein